MATVGVKGFKLAIHFDQTTVCQARAHLRAVHIHSFIIYPYPLFVMCSYIMPGFGIFTSTAVPAGKRKVAVGPPVLVFSPPYTIQCCVCLSSGRNVLWLNGAS